MSNEFIQAADSARRLLQGFAAVQVVADAFEKVGTLQQAGDEAQARLDAFSPLIADAQARVAELGAQIAVLEAETQVERDKALQVFADAQTAATNLVEMAQVHASELTANAQAWADETTASARDIVATARDNRDALAAEVDTLQGKLDELKAQAAKLLG
jgi:chromosome segregation ATPase